MPRRALPRLAEAARIAALVLTLVPQPFLAAAAEVPGAHFASEDDIAPPSLVPLRAGELQLVVTINSQPTNKIIGFTDLGGGRLAAKRRELEEIGIRPPGGGPPDELIELDAIPSVAYFYDEPLQRIDIGAMDESRIPKVYDASRFEDGREAARADYGAVLNYALFAAGSADTDDIDVPDFSGVNLSLDGRVFTPTGVLSQTGIVGQTVGSEYDVGDPGYLRLDTTYTYADEQDMILYRAGDVISGGPAWTRPVRLGGIQAQRSFRLRPDLVTQSLPSVAGSAAVPSTVDVFVNNAKTYTRDVAAGPFQIDNLPVLNGSGTARVVVRDAAGRESEQVLSFYSSPQLLRPGLWDFSIETGVARLDYGLRSGGYDGALLASGSIKSGLYEDLTLEAHAEGGDGLINAGAGAVVRVGDLGVASVAASASANGGDSGFQLYGSFDTKAGPVTINVRAQHAFEDYADLASISFRSGGNGLPGLFAPGGIFSIVPPRAVDSLGVTVPLEFDGSTLGVNLVHYEGIDGETSNLVTATYSRSLIENATLVATGFADLSDKRSAALFVGVNVPLGDNGSLNGGILQKDDSTSFTLDASKSLSQEPGSWGWRARDHEGGSSYRLAEVSYRAPSMRVAGGVRHERSSLRGTIEVEGAIASVGGDVFTSNRIDDAFAVVDAGSPGVRVLRQNNFVGETNEDGKILIPNLNSYEENKLSIDPMNLPLNAEIAEVNTSVTPAFRSGIYVDFEVKRQVPNAIVVLTDAAGEYLPAGSEVTLAGSSETFLVGYDGQAYITGLGPVNHVSVKVGGDTCHASFPFELQADAQMTIGPEVCQ